jgi:hypothetical protein
MSASKVEHHLEHPLPSEKSFALVMATAFAIFGLITWLKHGTISLIWTSLVAFFIFAAFLFPLKLRPLNILWMKFGLFLGKVMTPVVMGLVFFFVVTPIALFMRALGKDLLNQKLDPAAVSYWIQRTPPGPDGKTMTRQF